MTGLGVLDRLLDTSEIENILEGAFSSLPLENKRVLVIVPDRTRTAPIPLMFRLINRLLAPRVRELNYLVALGTHQPLSEREMHALVGLDADTGDRLPSNVGLHNHQWSDPESFVEVGTIPRDEIERIAAPLLEGLPHDSDLLRPLPVTLNRMVLEHDHLIVCGPTFPHEVAGYSGGNKYFFPGVSGPDVINYTHWLGAVMTSYRTIGVKRTPVRAVIDRAASLIDRPKTCCSMVVQKGGLAGLFVASPEEAFDAAADLSSQLHIEWVDRPYQRVLSIMPPMYDDLWTAAKGMYKLEPVVADGGELIIFAPHIDEVSYTHGRLIDEVGYHVFEYFFKQWDRFRHYPGGVLAHSTHLKGLGSYNQKTGVENPRIRVTLATRIPAERCRRLSLGYRAPETVDLDNWEARGEGCLKVPKAGEQLYRIRTH